jgi:hypothetical protein
MSQRMDRFFVLESRILEKTKDGKFQNIVAFGEGAEIRGGFSVAGAGDSHSEPSPGQ